MHSNGVHVISTTRWGVDNADIILFCDACPLGLGFWYPAGNIGFHHPFTTIPGDHSIFYCEAPTVVSAIDLAVQHLHLHCGSCLAIFSDNSNTVNMFNSLEAQPLHNPLLTTAVDLLLWSHIQLHVFHIPGEHNVVADALSCSLFHNAHIHSSALQIHPFTPSWLTLGAVQQWTDCPLALGNLWGLPGAASILSMLKHSHSAAQSRLHPLPLMALCSIHTFLSAALTIFQSNPCLTLWASTQSTWHTTSNQVQWIPTCLESAMSLNPSILMSVKIIAITLSLRLYEVARSFSPSPPCANDHLLILNLLSFMMNTCLPTIMMTSCFLSFYWSGSMPSCTLVSWSGQIRKPYKISRKCPLMTQWSFCLKILHSFYQAIKLTISLKETESSFSVIPLAMTLMNLFINI